MLDALAFNAARELQDAGRLDEARAAYRRIVARNPKHFESHAQLALIDLAQGRLADALKENARALKLRPDIAGLHNNNGSILLGMGRAKDAAASFETAVRLDPRDAQARNNLGGALSKLGRFKEALANIEAAIALLPRYAKAHADRAMVLNRIGRATEAIESAERAVALNPAFAEAHDHRGVALVRLNRFDEALAAFDAAIAADPTFALAHSNRGGVLELMRRDDEALQSFRRALELDASLSLAAGAAVQLRLRTCDWEGVAKDAAAVLARIDAGAAAAPPLTVVALTESPALQRKAAALHTMAAVPLRTPARVQNPRGEKIRIGYFSPDFGDHPVSHAIAGVLERHDRTRCEVTAFLIAPRAADGFQARVRSAVARFIDVSGAGDEEVAAQARALGLDIAIDLAGYTTNARPGIFSYGAAPVQATWLGYPGTLSNDALPYLIADSVVIPEDRRADYAEKIVRLPHCFFPPDDRRVVPPAPSRAEAGLPERGFVFCSFNAAAKITPAVFASWMRLLAGTPASVLWLGIQNSRAQENLRAAAARLGVDAGRILFAPRVERPQHLARQRLADLFLDCFPYGAHSSAADALQAGLPVLTMPGPSFASRVAASLLTSLRMPNLIAHDGPDYERRALEIAHDAALAARIKATLAGNIATTPTFDTGRFTRGLERAYAALAERAAAGLAPDSLTVGDGP
ncbi:MAG: tetratricopeptide repeat protein [Rhodospirillaceae bacterium]